MKRPTTLVKAILRQAAMDLDLSVERDVTTLSRRCKHEGLSFLTITLPTLSDSLEKGIESGLFSCPTSFSRHGRLPRFLGGFFKRVFTLDGRLRDDACPYAVFYIRQVCRFFKKLKLECSATVNRRATQHFVDVEGDLRAMTPLVERKDILLDKISGIIWSQVFPEIDPNDLICHHGPGATAERYSLNEREHIRKWNQRSEFSYPSDLHAFPNYGLAAQYAGIGERDSLADGLRYFDVSEEESVRVVFVPKTQTSPRVIAIEPSHVQFMQQSLMDYVYPIIETHPLTKQSIRFTDQTVNQRLAYSSSIDKRLATLDLKDASDRVHLHLVQRIFKTSGLLPYLEDCRSLHATLPDGRNIVLFKYASMGSAMCFPVEAMVFYTLIQTAMHELDGVRPCSRSIRNYSRLIDIYGDDIIIPVDYTDVVVKYLESYALKVNVNKSFRNSNFRESCGADYYKGVPVNPVYARKVPHDTSRDWEAETVMSWNATADLFYRRGMWIVAQEIRDMLCRMVRKSIPKSRELGSGLSFFSYLFTTDLRYDRDLQCWKQKRIHYDPIKRKDNIDGHELATLNKWAHQSFARRTGHHRNHRSVAHQSGGLLRQRRELESSKTRVGYRDPQVDCFVTSDSVEQVCHGLSGDRYSDSFAQVMVKRCNTIRSDGVLPTGRYGGSPADYAVDTTISDPLSFLTGRSQGIDFQASTKRGCFKSKSRWVSLAG